MSEPFPSQPFAGRAALVTGVSRRAGIGFAVARRLAQGGAAVAIQAHTAYDERVGRAEPDGPEACRDAIAAFGHETRLVHADLGDASEPARAVDATFDAFGRLDIVVANHTHWAEGGLDAVTADSLDRHWAVITRASLLLAQALGRRREPGPGGRVVFFSSGQHLGPMPGEIGYVVAKGALVQAVPTLADEFAERGITVNAINPGPNDTGWIPDALRPELLGRSPLGRIGIPEDTADAVAFLCSEQGGWITGQVLNSEGGFRRG